jgi:hypothetical protein
MNICKYPEHNRQLMTALILHKEADLHVNNKSDSLPAGRLLIGVDLHWGFST